MLSNDKVKHSYRLFHLLFLIVRFILINYQIIVCEIHNFITDENLENIILIELMMYADVCC